jgi:type I restriction enzyme S subunit
MASWCTEGLAEVLQFREGPGIMAADFRDRGVPLIRLAGLKRGASLFEGCNYLDPAKVERKWSQFQLREGDVLLSTSASLGEVALVGRDGVGAVPYTGIIAFRPRGQRVDASFIRHMLTTTSFKAQIEAMGVGSVMKHFGPSHLRQMTVTFPIALGEQRAIAEVLDALDDKIAANDRLVAKGDAFAEALTTGAFIDEEVPLSAIADVSMGSSPPGTSYNENRLGTPFFQGVRDFGARQPKRRVWTSKPVRLAEPTDTLLSVRAPVGRTNLAGERICIGRGLAVLRSRTGTPMSLFHQVRAAHAAWMPFEAEGTVFGAINKAQLESIAIPSVDPSRAALLESRLAALEATIAAALLENERLAQSRDELLPLLMSGKVRVKDAGHVVERAPDG